MLMRAVLMPASFQRPVVRFPVAANGMQIPGIATIDEGGPRTVIVTVHHDTADESNNAELYGESTGNVVCTPQLR